MEEKRKTSRISLESALAMGGEGAKEPAARPGEIVPKTIRLKRPSEATTIRAKPLPEIPKGPPAAETAPVVMSQTAQLEESPAAGEEAPTPTKRKTIRVKRPGADGERESPAVAVAAQRAVGPAPDEPHWFFAVVAVATIIVTFVIIYVFLAQAIGPNSSLTELSSYKEGWELGWPGKIPTPVR